MTKGQEQRDFRKEVRALGVETRRIATMDAEEEARLAPILEQLEEDAKDG